jgi:hypothetical protein
MLVDIKNETSPTMAGLKYTNNDLITLCIIFIYSHPARCVFFSKSGYIVKYSRYFQDCHFSG